MSDPIPAAMCGCGWRRPLFAITTPSGEPPTETLLVRYACPNCRRVHVCQEIAPDVAAQSKRARELAAAEAPLVVPLRFIV